MSPPSLSPSKLADGSISTLLTKAAGGDDDKFADALMKQVKHLRKELENDPDAARGLRDGGRAGGGAPPDGPRWSLSDQQVPVNGTVYRIPYVPANGFV